MSANAVPQLLSRADVCRVLNVSLSSLLRIEARGRLKRVQLPESRRALYHPDDVQALIEHGREEQ